MKVLIVFIKICMYCSVTAFFVTSSYISIKIYDLVLIKLPYYESLWEGGFRTVESVEKVSTALYLTIPELSKEVAKISTSMKTIEQSMVRMDYSIGTISFTISNQMGHMNNQMGQLNDSFHPMGMMKKMMFW
ncbi:hypothetical protein HOB94_03815 [bacterium]|nr:hypothetical protein [bacterium]MBT4633085.1 hypothetical protein [bacterium]MBT6778630.1 hypothetical protein [bacterium]